MLTIDPWVLKNDVLKIGSNFGPKSKGCKKDGIDYEQKVSARFSKFVREEMPDWKIMLGPWYQNKKTRRWRQPDIVMIHPEDNVGIVIEVKLNWKEGRDEKLRDIYLPIVKSTHGLDCVWPLLVTRCIRGFQHPIITRLQDLDRCQSWLPGDPTPMMMLVL